MTEREKLRLELLELQMAALMRENCSVSFYSVKDQEINNKRMEELVYLIIKLSGDK